MDLEGIMLSKKSASKDKYMISLTCRISKTNEQDKTESYRYENKQVVTTRGEEWGGGLVGWWQ